MWAGMLRRRSRRVSLPATVRSASAGATRFAVEAEDDEAPEEEDDDEEDDDAAPSRSLLLRLLLLLLWLLLCFSWCRRADDELWSVASLSRAAELRRASLLLRSLMLLPSLLPLLLLMRGFTPELPCCGCCSSSAAVGEVPEMEARDDGRASDEE
jgi:hypothetical protein